jgi:uncharacterized protein YfiM (DUF2279 family)
MRIITIILLLFISISSFSHNTWKNEWLKQDKAIHLTFSAMLTALGTETAKDFKFKNPEIAGVTFSLICGLSKEFLYDSKPSAYDLTADIVGSIAGVYVNRLFNKWETKKYYKK